MIFEIISKDNDFGYTTYSVKNTLLKEGFSDIFVKIIRTTNKDISFLFIKGRYIKSVFKVSYLLFNHDMNICLIKDQEFITDHLSSGLLGGDGGDRVSLAKIIGYGLCLLGAGVGFQYLRHNHKYKKYDNQLEVFDVSESNKRIIDSLQKSKNIKKGNGIDLNEIKDIANITNSSFIHYSGNCSVLSVCFLYNLMTKNEFITAKNLYPITKGSDPNQVANILFKKDLTGLGEYSSIKDLTDSILAKCIEHEVFYFLILSGGYSVPFIGESGHCFNAVVIRDCLGKFCVQYIDCWKTSNISPSKNQLESKFMSKNAYFELYCIDFD